MTEGVIKRYLDERGFGFIRPNDGDADVFFHIAGMAPGSQPKGGERVSYELTIGMNGRPRAINVRLLD